MKKLVFLLEKTQFQNEYLHSLEDIWGGGNLKILKKLCFSYLAKCLFFLRKYCKNNLKILIKAEYWQEKLIKVKFKKN